MARVSPRGRPVATRVTRRVDASATSRGWKVSARSEPTSQKTDVSRYTRRVDGSYGIVEPSCGPKAKVRRGLMRQRFKRVVIPFDAREPAAFPTVCDT
jgi:hypothetical protein